jgi:acetoacetyl-CoA synthetase
METTPVWQPDDNQLTQFDRFETFLKEKNGLQFANYTQLHEWSVHQSSQFWEALSQFFNLQWHEYAYQTMSEAEEPWQVEWFLGGKLNYAEHLLRRDDEHPALISYDEHGHRETLSFHQLRQQVAACAAFLKSQHIGEGDRVVGILPNYPQTIVAMLACASMGAIWASCSPDFGETAIIERFKQIKPKLLITVLKSNYNGKTHDYGDKIRAVLSVIPSMQQVVWLDESTQTDLENFMWESFIHQQATLTFASLSFNHPLYILFSSGTTGQPKCMVHRAGGVLLQHLKELALHSDLGENQRMLFYTTCGWMMWNWMVSALALGSSLVLYEGSPVYPNAMHLLDIVEETQTQVLGASAAYFAALENANIKRKQLPSLKRILSTGSPLLAQQYDDIFRWLGRTVQICSISGGSDIVSCFALGHPKLPVYKGELQCLGLGMDVAVFNEVGRAVEGEKGELVCRKPFPSMPLRFWNDEGFVKYRESYFEVYPHIWAHGDFAEKTVHGGLIIYGRSDATLNPQGIRFGSAELYHVVKRIDGIDDCVAVGQAWKNSERVLLFIKLLPDAIWSDALKNDIRHAIRTQLSPRHVPAKILQVSDIPKTINGKIMEKAVKKIVAGEKVENLAVIMNPECLQDYALREEILQD